MNKLLASSVLAIGLSGGVALLAYSAVAQRQAETDRELIDHGRYLVRAAGCNDCHTPGYAEAEGDVPEARWLTGDAFGWTGPWGTTYATNLRLYMHALTEEQWLTVARSFRPRPPMPFFNVNAMSDRDLRAIYRYTRALGPAGEPAPTYLEPSETPPIPYAEFRFGPAH